MKKNDERIVSSVAELMLKEPSNNVPSLAHALNCLSFDSATEVDSQTIKKFISGSLSVWTQLFDPLSSAARFQITWSVSMAV